MTPAARPPAPTPPTALSEPLAEALWQARATAMPLRAADWPIGSRAAAEAIAEQLYAAERAAGARVIGSKLAVTDEAAQRRFGADRPFAAPIHDSTLLEDGEPLPLSGLIAPMLEVEIGLIALANRVAAVPCLEVADCRFAGWEVAVEQLIADFGAQARFLFGEALSDAAAPRGEIAVVLRHDGETVAAGTGHLAAAHERLRLAREESSRGPGPRGAARVVATGAILPPEPLAPGRWELDTDALGTLALEVEG